MSGLSGSSSDISSSSSWLSGRVRLVTSSEFSPEEVPLASRSSMTSLADLADGKPGSCEVVVLLDDHIFLKHDLRSISLDCVDSLSHLEVLLT